MPIRKKWSVFSWDNVDRAPEEPGIYELGNLKGEIVYVGKAGNLRQRLSQHKNDPSKARSKYFRYATTALFFDSPLDMERRHGEKYEEKHGRLPSKQKRLPRCHWPF